MIRFARCLAALVVTAGLAAGLTSPSVAAPPTPSMPSQASIQKVIDTKMRLMPGGRQVGPDKIVWDKLGMSAEFGAAGISNCQYEYLCLYGDSDFNDGPDVTPWKLVFWRCDVLIDLRPGGYNNQASSVVNNQTYGTVGWLYHWTYRQTDTPELIWAHGPIGGGGGYDNLLDRNDDTDLVEACR
jgi:hypothetical protein